MKVKCEICGAEIEEEDAIKQGDAVICEECFMERSKDRCR